MSITPLTQALIDSDQLSLRERNEKLATIALSSWQKDPQGFRDELDAKLAASDIVPKDYGFMLHASASLPWALDILKSPQYPPIVVTAIELFGKAWRKDPAATAQLVSDATLVELINQNLPRYATARLFKVIGSVPQLTLAHQTTVDNILKAIFPFLTPNPSTPLSRYARSSIINLITAATPPVLLEIINRCTSWFDNSTWQKVAERRPEVAKELLLQRVDPTRPISSDDLIHRNNTNIRILRTVLRESQDDAFLKKFIELHVAQILLDKDAPDVFGQSRNQRAKTLLVFIAFILRKRTSKGKQIETALDYCGILNRLVDENAASKWSLADAQDLLEIVCYAYGKAPGEWVLQTGYETATANATAVLSSIFRNMEYSKTFFPNPSIGLFKLLHSLPLPARLPFLNIFFATKTNSSLVVPPENIESYPRFSAALLAILSPEHGQRILEVGTAAKKASFLTTHGSRSAYTFNHTTESATPTLHAIWAAAQRSPLGSRAADYGHADEATMRDVEDFKQQAIRSRDNRPVLVRQALELSILSRSPTLFIDTLWWAVKRYAKDPETGPAIMNMFCYKDGIVEALYSGPIGFYASDRTRGKLTKEMLQEWSLKMNEVIDALLHLLSVYVSEPSYVDNMKSHYSSVESALTTIVQYRIGFAELAFPTLVNDIDVLRDTLFMPLVAPWIKLERFKVEEHPTILGFDVNNCSPGISGDVGSIHHRILPAVFPFIERLCEERETLYNEGRRKLAIGGVKVNSRRRALEYTSINRHILPFTITNITGVDGDDSCRKVTLPKRVAEYVDSIVFKSPSANLAASSDQLDWYPTQFSMALESYLSYSESRDEIDSKIIQLWDLYGPSESRADLRSALLGSDTVQRALWSRSNLTKLVLPWLPEFPPTDNSNNTDFNPISIIPPNMPEAIDGEDSLLILRQDEATKLVAFGALLFPFLNFRPTPISLRHISRNALQKLTVFTVAWILTTLEVPRDVSLVGSNATGPVAHAIRNVRLHESFFEEFKNRSTRNNTPCYLLNQLLPSLPLSEVDLLARAVFSAQKTPTNEPIKLAVLSHLLSLGVPSLGSEQAFHVLEDVEASSWHRQAITPTRINYSPPQEAQDSMKRLLAYTQERQRAQKERQKEQRKNTSDGIAVSTEEQAPLLKTSTHKMVLQLLAVTALQGSIDAQAIEGYSAEGLLETPSSIRSYAVDVLITVVQDLFVITGDEWGKSSGMWGMLSPFINVAQRLHEDVNFTEQQWAAARAGTGPMPDIIEERHVATSLLYAGNMSSSLKRAWAEKVVYPIITGHVDAQTKWLRTAIAREGGSKDLEDSVYAINGSGISVSTLFKTFAAYLPENNPLLQILEREGLGFLSRPTCQKLLDLMEKNHKSGWERETYGRTVKLVTWYAISDSKNSGVSARSAIHSVLVTPNMPSSLLNDCLASLSRIGLTLLRPENSKVHTDAKVYAPYSSFKRFVVDTLAPTSTYSLSSKVLHLLSEFLAEVESSEKRESAACFNGGANYWSLIITLKLLNLRVATNTTTHDSDWAQARARQLFELAELVANGGWHHVQFPEAYAPYMRLSRTEDLMPVCLALTQVPIAPAEHGWLRALCFDIAATLIRTHQSDIVASGSSHRQLSKLREIWQSDPDGSVGWLALSCTDPDCSVGRPALGYIDLV